MTDTPTARSASPAPFARWTTTVDGQRLRQVRHQRALSQGQLAERAGISPATVSRLERQSTAPCRCRTLARLAGALGEDPGRLTPASQL